MNELQRRIAELTDQNAFLTGIIDLAMTKCCEDGSDGAIAAEMFRIENDQTMKTQRPSSPMTARKKTSKLAKAVAGQSLGAAPCSALWAVMKAHAWDSITTVHGIPLMCPPEGPHRFIPVFATREQAVAWAGSDEHVAMLMPNSVDMSPKGKPKNYPPKTAAESDSSTSPE